MKLVKVEDMKSVVRWREKRKTYVASRKWNWDEEENDEGRNKRIMNVR
jgi:hypothetical protein